ncbi:MAG: 4-hydroxy-tetrahydrodipicolinate reductase [Candidatus Ancaeobacter aquaticus]|nr:4-hydroxy-tetrahydrodipicolinate reductase [Candidatus Ancaeobacter aquaticus]
MIQVVVCGATGKMGRRIIACAAEDADIKIVGAVDRKDNPDIGKDSGELSGCAKNSVPISGDLAAVIDGADVVIDFSFHEATVDVAECCKKNKKPLVIGTTGFSTQELEKVKANADSIALLIAPNMSIGANVLFHKAGEIARILGDDYDIEIIEAHHKFKKDAPSGTANKIAEVLAEARGSDIEKCGVYGRKGDNALRNKEDIGVHVVRGGDIIGEHTVLYCGMGERIELSHKASTRDNFAKGALRAVKYLKDAAPGIYDMGDVLSLK